MPGSLVIGGISCDIYFGDGDTAIEESLAEGGEGPRATVTFSCAYGDRYGLLKGLAGSASGGPGSIVRTPPFAYPPSPNLFCVGVQSIRGVGWKFDPGAGWATASEARVVATFGIPKFGFEAAGSNPDPTGLPYTNTRMRITSEFLKPTYGGTFYWITGGGGPQDGKPVPDSAASIIFPHLEISITRAWVPYIPIDECLLCLGTVNDSPIRLGNRVFPTGTLLFAGMNATETADSLGNRTFEVEYIILGNDTIQWNEVIQSDSLFYLVNTDPSGSGEFVYHYHDFWNELP